MALLFEREFVISNRLHGGRKDKNLPNDAVMNQIFPEEDIRLDYIDDRISPVEYTKRTATRGFKKMMSDVGSKVSSAVTEKILPAVLDQLVTRIIGRITAAPANEKSAVIKGGAAVLGSAFGRHGRRLDRPQIIQVLKGKPSGIYKNFARLYER